MPESDTAPLIGRNPVREVLERGEVGIEKVMLEPGISGERIGAIRAMAKERGIPVQYVPQTRLDHEADGAVHQGVVAKVAPIRYREVNAMLADIAATWDAVQTRKPLLLIIDRVTDPRNLGAILRSAVAAGVDGVIVPARHMAPLNAAALKASAGMAHRVPIARTSKLSTVLIQLKERGYWVCGADGAAPTPFYDVDWDRPVALVMGSEGQGLADNVAAACDVRASIPMRGPAESLNVAVAAGILLFEAARPRTTAPAEAPSPSLD